MFWCPEAYKICIYGPSTSYNKILTVPYGTYLDVYGWSGEWAYVSYSGKNGWVNSNYLY